MYVSNILKCRLGLLKRKRNFPMYPPLKRSFISNNYFPPGANVTSFGPGTGEVFVDDLECAGNETALLECQHSPLALHNCMHHEDIGVLCTVPPPSGISSQLGLFLGGGGGCFGV